MNKNSFIAAFVIGAAAVLWVAIGFLNTNPLALVMTLLIGAVYLAGASELRNFCRATATLNAALAAVPETMESLGEWLNRIDVSLQNSVRLRVEGERVGLPGPALTPYLTGLLVMLGMLGTFLGMVVTFKGAAFAMEGTTDLEAIRASLTTPIKGLGLAFGTSVAGVAASSMLGLLSAFSRRERLQAAQLLDASIATSALRGFSLGYQRLETFKAIQLQAQTLPAVVDRLQALMTTLEQHSQQLGERLVGSQENFHHELKGTYLELAQSVDRSLKESVSASVRAAGETIKPVAEAALSGIARETTQLQARMIDSTQAQLQALTANIEQRSSSMLALISDTLASRQAEQDATDRQRLAAWTRSLEAMSATLQHEWQVAGAQTLAQQQQICSTLDTTARTITAQAQANADDTLKEITRLLDTATEAPRAAAEVIGQLRQELSSSMARDNALLEERSRIMTSLAVLLDAVNSASEEQRETVNSLVTSSAALLDRIGERYSEQVTADSARIADVAANISGSAIEVASLGETMNFAVQLFSDSNEKLIANLQRIEAALDKSMARSDEQLTYYVTQAREVIDLSIMSQKEVVEDLRRLGGEAGQTGARPGGKTESPSALAAEAG